ncbi:MAG: restriction endonuclease subunit S [Clostridium sp.]|nr:restriction endonuclease subunit S [Clostridium sp.]
MNLNVESWKEFRLGDLFSEIYKAEAHVKGELECYNVPSDNTIRFISRTEMNNGCDCYVLNNDLSGIEKANAIAIGDTTATCFYQGEDFVCGDHMVICRADWLNLYTALFLISILKQEKYKYSYGRAFKMDLISNTIIKLPSTPDNEPDWNYMEQYIKSIKHKPLSTANQGGYSSLTLGVESWKPFKVNDIFKLYNGKGITKEEIEYNQGDFIVVQSGEENNGCIGKIDKDYCNKMGYTYTEEPCLTVARTGSAGYVSYQPLGCVVGDSAKILTLKDDHHKNHSVFLFLKTVLMANRYKYTYGRKVTEDKYLSEVIMLPATTDNKPDFCFMENYIKSLPYGDRI